MGGKRKKPSADDVVEERRKSDHLDEEQQRRDWWEHEETEQDRQLKEAWWSYWDERDANEKRDAAGADLEPHETPATDGQRLPPGIVLETLNFVQDAYDERMQKYGKASQTKVNVDLRADRTVMALSTVKRYWPHLKK